MSTESFHSPAVTFTAPASGETTAHEVVNPGTSAEQEPPEQEPKTFTQEELDAAVQKRLGIEKRKWERDQRKAQETPQQVTEPPKRENFKDDGSFLDALVDYKAEQKIAEREQKKQAETIDSTHDERVEQFRDKTPDYDTKISADGWYCSEVAYAAIKESDVGPAIAYYLASHTQESKRIWEMKSAVSQIREIGKIEAKLLTETPATKVSSAPEPIKPVGQRSSTPKYDTTDPRAAKHMSTSEWIAAENAREAAKRAR